MVKNMKKLTMLMIAVVAIGTFALPNVLTASVGQHTFNPGSTVDCLKCHPMDAPSGVGAELNASGVTDFGTAFNDVDALDAIAGPSGYVPGKKIHSELGCEGCHQATTSSTIPTATHVGVDNAPICDDCHLHVTANNVGAEELNGADEVHKGLGTAGVNTACIGCHTAVGVTGFVSYAFVPEDQVIGYGLTITANP